MQHVGVRQDEGRSVGAVMKEALGLYQACTENGIVPAMSEIREFDWECDDYSGQVVILANQVAVPDEYVKNIENFVSRGGKLIVTGLTGFWGTDNICLACTDFPYENLFGASFKEVIHVGDRIDIRLDNPSLVLPSHMWVSTLSLNTAEPVASYDGETICARNTFGKGTVLWIPSLVGLGKRRTADMALSSLLQLEFAGLDLPVKFAMPEENLLMNTLKSGDSFVTIIINKGTDPVLIPLSVKEGYSPQMLFAGSQGRIMNGNIANVLPEETLVVKWICNK